MSTGSMPRSATIVVIGDEILSGEVSDENAGFLARELTGLGIRVERIRIVGDRQAAIVAELREAMASSDLVLVSGGIGPTHDDCTREASAEAMSVPCRHHPEAEARLKSGYGPSITEAELRMADLPEGSRLLPGRRTGVFGFRVGALHVLPGIPHLLRDIFGNLAEGWGGDAPLRDEVRTHLREGRIADGLRELQTECPDVAIGSYPYRCEEGYRVRIVLRSRDRASLEQARSRVESLLEAAVTRSRGATRSGR